MSKPGTGAIIYVALLALAIFGCRKPKNVPWQQQLQQRQLTASQFTEIVAAAVRETLPNCEVEVIKPLEISVNSESGKSTCYLDNVWNQAREDVDIRVDAVNRHLGALRSTLEVMSQDADLDIADIVPIIKDKLWLEESEQQGLHVYREVFAADLYVVYAEDGAHQLAFISDEQMKSFQLSPSEFRKRAIVNLEQRLPSVNRHGKGPLYMFTAGGTFESSLLLLDEIWQDQADAVDGRLLVAIPSREILLFTGENATEAVQQMQSQIDDVYASGSYLITKSMLVREQGTWVGYAP